MQPVGFSQIGSIFKANVKGKTFGGAQRVKFEVARRGIVKKNYPPVFQRLLIFQRKAGNLGCFRYFCAQFVILNIYGWSVKRSS